VLRVSHTDGIILSTFIWFLPRRLPQSLSLFDPRLLLLIVGEFGCGGLLLALALALVHHDDLVGDHRLKADLWKKVMTFISSLINLLFTIHEYCVSKQM
jgi:hypothetical protein